MQKVGAIQHRMCYSMKGQIQGAGGPDPQDVHIAIIDTDPRHFSPVLNIYPPPLPFGNSELIASAMYSETLIM